jgi:RNA polymerase sigma-70 factor (ECF subfamily)
MATEALALALEPETDTLACAATGDAEAFAGLVRRHQRMVYSIAWNFFGDSTLADDLAQDVFVQLFQNLRSIESEAHLVFWLRQVTARKCIDHHRWRLRRKHVALEDWVETGETADGPDLLALGRVRKLVRALPERLRAVVVLRYQDDLAPEEIARTLGWPLNTVKSRLHRALKMLRTRLEERK